MADQRPVPDPTALTTDALHREIRQLQILLETRLQVVEAQVEGQRELVQQRKEWVDKHFVHLDQVRAEDKRESRALVDLALSAQKEASSTALTAANLAIDKAAESTGKRYDVLDTAVGEIRVAMASMMPRKESEARHGAHEQAVSLLSSRVTAIEATKVGGKEQMAGIYSVAAFVASVVAVIGVLAAAGVFSKS